MPISSDGHLAIAQVLLLHSGVAMTLTVALHGGTLASVLVYYRRDLWHLGRHALALLPGVPGARHLDDPAALSPAARKSVLIGIIAATIPTGIVGLLLRSPVERWSASGLIVGGCLILSGVANFVVARGRSAPPRHEEDIRITDAVLIGFFQGLAVLPGLSRSGSTIATGVALGLDKQVAARFSFLMSVPAVAGALLLYVRELVQGTPDLSPGVLLLGGVVSFVVGLGALHLLIAVLRRGRFAAFAIYCWILGPLVIVLALFGVLPK